MNLHNFFDRMKNAIDKEAGPNEPAVSSEDNSLTPPRVVHGCAVHRGR